VRLISPPRRCGDSIPAALHLRTRNVLFRWIDGGHMKPCAYSETVWKPALVAAGIIPEPIRDKRGRKR
jgi:hypothetical protein